MARAVVAWFEQPSLSFKMVFYVVVALLPLFMAYSKTDETARRLDSMEKREATEHKEIVDELRWIRSELLKQAGKK